MASDTAVLTLAEVVASFGAGAWLVLMAKGKVVLGSVAEGVFKTRVVIGVVKEDDVDDA